ncbi:MAG: hypothetical protein ACKPKO_15710, partial [Candidatus Fonsibacter sp.]
KLLGQFDQAQGVHHSVSISCVGSGLGTLRADMEARVAGHGMSPRLSHEIRAYQLCMLDDTVVEAVHRDVPRQAHRSPGATLHWWASSVRLDQNLKT